MAVIKKRVTIAIISIFILLLGLQWMMNYGAQVIENDYRHALQEKSKFAKQDFHMALGYLEHQKEQFLVNLQLAESGLLSHQSLNNLQNFPKFNLFSQIDSQANKLQSNISGIGDKGRLTASVKHEISAAMTLALWTVTKDKHFDYIWSYYTSIHRFMVLAPYVSAQQYQLKETSFDKDIWKVVPQYQTQKAKAYYSELYNDSAGAGYIVSASYPVYYKGELTGFLSLDIGLKQLHVALQTALINLQDEGLSGELYIVNKKGIEIASLQQPQLNHKVVKAQQIEESLSSMLELEDSYLFSNEIIENEFYGIVLIDKADYLISVIKNIFEQLVIVLAFAFCLLMMFHLHKRLRATKKISREDPLTGLNNRRTLMQLGAKILRENNVVEAATGCLIVDIDHFKKINDNFGHSVGDQAICFVSQLLKDSFRKNDLVARYGGEEFVILLPQVDKNSLVTLAEKLRVEIQDTQMQAHSINITVSVGCAISMKSDIKLNTLIDLADNQLYKAKESGRNRVAFE